MLATNYITVDVGSRSVPPIVSAEQGDKGYSVIVTVLNNGVQAVDHTTDTAHVYVHKSDGHGVGIEATVNEDNTISFVTTEQMLAAYGKTEVQITVYGPNNLIKSTPVFIFNVERKPILDNIASTNDYTMFNSLIPNLLVYLENYIDECLSVYENGNISTY